MNDPDKLANHRSTVDLPSYSDIVIIGSGYAGSSCAYYLYKHGQALNNTPLTITMLEARETCSGATGRNSGYMTADIYSTYKNFLKDYGLQTTEEMIQFEVKHFEALPKIISEEDIQCDWKLMRSCHAYYDAETAAEAKASYDQRRTDGGDVTDIHEIPPDDLPSVTRLKNAFYALTLTGASLHPYKLVHHFLNKCVEQGMNLQTNTPVLAASRLPSGQWSIVTSRGTLQASKVIFATNAYTGGIVPLLSEKVIPERLAACRILPSTNYTISPLETNYLLQSKGEQFDYFHMRPSGDRSIILGGGKSAYHSDTDAWHNNWDDSSEYINEKSKQYFNDFMPKYLQNWGSDQSGCKEMWTGIIGGTSDYMPFVGELPDLKNGYVIAGFNGHGLSRILLCARALIDLVLGRVDKIDGLIPAPFVLTKARLDT